MWRLAVSTVLSVTTRYVTNTAKAVTGRLMKNTHRQLNSSVRKPPSSGPTALPSPATPRISPPARPAFSSGSSAYVIPRIAGHISAPPMPMRPRHTINGTTLGMRPAASEKTAKKPAPIMKMRLRPNRSARRPPVTISTPNTSAYPLITHCADVSVVFRSCSISGIATLKRGEVVGDHEHAERHGHEREHRAPVDLAAGPVMSALVASANPDRRAGD